MYLAFGLLAVIVFGSLNTIQSAVIVIPNFGRYAVLSGFTIKLSFGRNSIGFWLSICLLLSVRQLSAPSRLVRHSVHQEPHAAIGAVVAVTLCHLRLEVRLMEENLKILLSLFATRLIDRIFVIHRADCRSRHRAREQRRNLLVPRTKHIAGKQLGRIPVLRNGLR